MIKYAHTGMGAFMLMGWVMMMMVMIMIMIVGVIVLEGLDDYWEVFVWDFCE
jgi:hypothetical protein